MPCLPGDICAKRLSFLFLSKRELLTQHPCDQERTGEGLKFREAEVREALLPLDVSWGVKARKKVTSQVHHPADTSHG